MAKKWQLRKVTGNGFLNDENIKAWGDASPEDEKEMSAFVDGRVGTMLDFLSSADIDKIMKAQDADDLDLESFQTHWQDKRLPFDTTYIWVDDPAQEVPEGLHQVVQKAKSGDRVTSARKSSAFSSAALREAEKNISANKAPEGGVWGVRRQGPPRV